MNPTFERRLAARPRTSRLLLALATAAAFSLPLGTGAQAQHGGHHDHQERAAGTPEGGAPRSGAAKARPPSSRQPGAGAGHAGHGASASDSPAVAEFKTAHAGMMRGMSVPYTGDPDVDFRIQMIPHHQGAIDMAQVAMRHAKDAWTRQLAEAVIVEQQREIAEMRAWLGRRGIAAPQGGQPLHTITASSYRHLDEEPGTRDEARGQSWAPGSGVPAQR